MLYVINLLLSLIITSEVFWVIKAEFVRPMHVPCKHLELYSDKCLCTRPCYRTRQLITRSFKPITYCTDFGVRPQLQVECHGIGAWTMTANLTAPNRYTVFSATYLRIHSDTISTLSKQNLHISSRLQTQTTLVSFLHSGINYIETKVLEEENLRSLRWLEIAFNNISTLRQNQFGNSNILQLSLSDNGITEIENGAFQGLQRLKTLNLKNNALVQINSGTFKGLRAVSEIDISNNLIKHIADEGFKPVQNLAYLYLERNHLCSIRRKVFNDISPKAGKKTEINLSENRIQIIESDSFAELLKTGAKIIRQSNRHTHDAISVKLWLNNNNISGVDPCWFGGFQQMKNSQTEGTKWLSVFLHNNPLVCDCSLVWLREVELSLLPLKFSSHHFSKVTNQLTNIDISCETSKYTILNYPEQNCSSEAKFWNCKPFSADQNNCTLPPTVAPRISVMKQGRLPTNSNQTKSNPDQETTIVALVIVVFILSSILILCAIYKVRQSDFMETCSFSFSHALVTIGSVYSSSQINGECYTIETTEHGMTSSRTGSLQSFLDTYM